MMPANLNARPLSTESRVRSILAFCQTLRQKIEHVNDATSAENLNTSLESEIQAITSYSFKSPSSSRHQQLDAAGTDLWNLCVRLRRQQPPQNYSVKSTPDPRSRLFTLARIYAFMILALAQSGAEHNGELGDLLRLQKLAVKTGRSCIDEGEFAFAPAVLKRAINFKDALKRLSETVPQDQLPTWQSLEAECWILQAAIAWKDNRLDLVEHFHEKVETVKQQLDTASVERLADTTFTIGRDLATRKDWQSATRWLERAHQWISTPELEQLSREALDLRLAIIQALVQSNLHAQTQDGLDKAENLARYLENEVGDSLMVLLLRLEILVAMPAESFDCSSYENVVRRIILSVDLSETTFKVVIHHIRKLEDKSPSSAISLLDQFLREKVLPSAFDEWIERLSVLRVLMATSYREASDSLQSLVAFLDRVRQATQKPLSATATNAIQTLIWKKVDASFTSGEFDLTASWCHVALHPSLEQCGPVNAAKISRKIILCAIESNEWDESLHIFQNLNDSSRLESMTLFLGFKIAIHRDEQVMAQACLDQIAEDSSGNPKFLYACCLEAQKVSEKRCAVRALQHLIRRYDVTSPGMINPAAMLRSIIRLQIALLEEQDKEQGGHAGLAADICDTFENAFKIIKTNPKDVEGNTLFTVPELDWFCKNAYNIGLKQTSSWDVHYVVRLFQTAVAIMQNYPTGIPTQLTIDLMLRSMFCHFMAATALLAMARAEDNTEFQLQHYLVMRKHIKGFSEGLDMDATDLDVTLRNDLELKLSALLVFDFEGAICLRSWDDLGGIVLRAKNCGEVAALQVMADCLLRAVDVPSQTLYSTLRKTINEIWSLEQFGSDKLAKYMRCLLQAMLPGNPEFPLQIAEEFGHCVREALENEKPFPNAEIEWFIATAFNHGVDLYGNGEDVLSKKWLAHSMTLAHYYQDGGVLEKDLQDRCTRLQWGDE